MKFYGREDELGALRSARDRSSKESQFTLVLGKRRIGKTWLVRQAFRDDRFVYLSMARMTEPILCMNLQNSLKAAGMDIYGRIGTVKELLIFLMKQSQDGVLTVVLDEFQELQYVNPAIFDDIREVWDIYSHESHLNLVVSGSIHSLMVRIFEDEEAPLFSRPTSKITVMPFPIRTLKAILKDSNPAYTNEDLLAFFMITGGVPFYVSNLVDSGCMDRDSMLKHVFSSSSVFLSDGRDILITELGRDYVSYFSILQAISTGRERRKEIEDVVGIQAGPYLERLRDEYGFIEQVSPVLSKRNTKNTRWVISDMYLRFYFRFVLPNQGLIDLGRGDMLLRIVFSELEGYEGRALEDYHRCRIGEEGSFTRIGGWWNRDGSAEIDIVVIDDIDMKVRFIEVKRDPEKFRRTKLIADSSQLLLALEGYDAEYGCLSMEDM